MTRAITLLLLSVSCAPLWSEPPAAVQTDIGLAYTCHAKYMRPHMVDLAIRAVADAAEGFGVADHDEAIAFILETEVICVERFEGRYAKYAGIYFPYQRRIWLKEDGYKDPCVVTQILAHEFVHAVQHMSEGIAPFVLSEEEKEQDRPVGAHVPPWFSRTPARTIFSTAKDAVRRECSW